MDFRKNDANLLSLIFRCRKGELLSILHQIEVSKTLENPYNYKTINMTNSKKIEVEGKSITILRENETEYISLTDMLKAKDGDFFISDWLRNRNTVEYLGIWEYVYNPDFNYGEFAVIKSQVKEWAESNPKPDVFLTKERILNLLEYLNCR